jgi:hypothetical protein
MIDDEPRPVWMSPLITHSRRCCCTPTQTVTELLDRYFADITFMPPGRESPSSEKAGERVGFGGSASGVVAAFRKVT